MVVASVLVLVGMLALYARTQVIDRDAFADRAVAALDRDAVREVVGRAIVTGLVDRGSTDLVAARPLVQTIVEAVLRTEAFRRVLRRAAVEANRVLFDREGSRVTLDLSDAVSVVRFAAQSVSPRVAREIPADLTPSLLSLQRREFAAQTLEVADRVRVLGVVLPPLAVLALVLAVAVAPDRRLALLRCGAAVALTGVLLAGVLLILYERTLAGVVGDDEVTDAEVQAAVGGVLSAFLGDLLLWALLLAVGGLVIAAAAASLDREHLEAPARPARPPAPAPPGEDLAAGRARACGDRGRDPRRARADARAADRGDPRGRLARVRRRRRAADRAPAPRPGRRPRAAAAGAPS